jgi:glutamyl-tRNA reductase
LGLSHKTAPIELRERVALSEDASATLLRKLVGTGVIAEAMVISTCNRMELYFVPSESASSTSAPSSPGLERDGEAVERALEALRFSAADLGKHIYLYQGKDAAKHLFRVASSLDSLVVGEPQILGQLKRGYEHARTLGVLGPALNRAAMRAFRAAKRVRSETTIGSGQVSIASVALDLARQIFDKLEGRTVALVGAGEMGEAIARLFQQAGAKLVILGRTERKFMALAKSVGAEGRAMSELERTLAEACVVVTSTSANLPVIGHELVQAAMRKRRGRDLFLVDVAVPRDIEEKVSSIDGVYLYNIDDLSSVIADTKSARRQGADQSEAILEEELVDFERREGASHVTPTIRALYATFRRTLRKEVERSFQGKLRELGTVEQMAVEHLVEAATKKLLHQSSTTLKRWVNERPEELDTMIEMIHELWIPRDPPEAENTTGPEFQSSPRVDDVARRGHTDDLARRANSSVPSGIEEDR